MTNLAKPDQKGCVIGSKAIIVCCSGLSLCTLIQLFYSSPNNKWQPWCNTALKLIQLRWSSLEQYETLKPVEKYQRINRRTVASTTLQLQLGLFDASLQQLQGISFIAVDPLEYSAGESLELNYTNRFQGPKVLECLPHTITLSSCQIILDFHLVSFKLPFTKEEESKMA